MFLLIGFVFFFFFFFCFCFLAAGYPRILVEPGCGGAGHYACTGLAKHGQSASRFIKVRVSSYLRRCLWYLNLSYLH